MSLRNTLGGHNVRGVDDRTRHRWREESSAGGVPLRTCIRRQAAGRRRTGRRRRGGDVSAGDARHGRGDNGLVAAEYAAAGDVDPRVGEHLLDVLALDGIAAYLRPSTDLHPVTRSSTLPGRPTDRLYVDRTHLATARDYLD